MPQRWNGAQSTLHVIPSLINVPIMYHKPRYWYFHRDPVINKWCVMASSDRQLPEAFKVFSPGIQIDNEMRVTQFLFHLDIFMNCFSEYSLLAIARQCDDETWKHVYGSGTLDSFRASHNGPRFIYMFIKNEFYQNGAAPNSAARWCTIFLYNCLRQLLHRYYLNGSNFRTNFFFIRLYIFLLHAPCLFWASKTIFTK